MVILKGAIMNRKKKSLDDYVMVFPITLLNDIGYFQGLSLDIGKYLNRIVAVGNCKTMKRDKAEIDENYKQLVTYVLVLHQDKFFSYQRGKKLGEARLFEKYSIGIGGHISNDDPSLFLSKKIFRIWEFINASVKREINEEIGLEDGYDLNIEALINDDTNAVGKVHFGIIFLAKIKDNQKIKKEQSINNAEFRTIQEIKNNFEKYENWSKICITEIDKLVK
jgi:predicted NUDIX family phosphoesterase